MNKQNLLIEIGTEELPPKALLPLSKAFQQEIEKGLKTANLAFEGSIPFATPRRLALRVSSLQDTQDDVHIERYGPATKAAYDESGKPTKAAEGFARSCGVEVGELSEKSDGKVTKLFYSDTRAGESAISLIPGIIETALEALPIPKRMRWGSSREEFVRPVHWVLILFGDMVVPATIMGIQSGNSTYGHRFHHPESITLDNPDSYEQVLTETAYVIPDFITRRTIIQEQILAQAAAIDASVEIDPVLLDEVNALVEWPVALTGSFDKKFLDIPKEALISSMKKHQKCFTLEDNDGNIKPYFITLSNIESKDPSKVISGNERVIRPRLADAAFFFEQDKKQSLMSRRDKLKTVIFEQTLGTVYDKSQRVSVLAVSIASILGISTEQTQRAAELAKCDLLTGMVGEFADLQGIMGYYYAIHDGEDEIVAKAINEQYLPGFSGDSLPETDIGIALALAERIDTIVGLFGIGQPPTGSKDPYALRRAALGILRIIVEKQLALDLSDCVANAINGYNNLPEPDGLQDKVLDFIFERFRAWYADEGIRANIFQAVDAVRSTSPYDFDLRIKAVQSFSTMNEALALSAANKRVSNILAKLDNQPTGNVQSKLLEEGAEKQLADNLGSLISQVQPLIDKKDYTTALSNMASLQKDVDAFFDTVMVNTDNEALRINRQTLLHNLRQLFLQIADISHLQST